MSVIQLSPQLQGAVRQMKTCSAEAVNAYEGGITSKTLNNEESFAIKAVFNRRKNGSADNEPLTAWT